MNARRSRILFLTIACFAFLGGRAQLVTNLRALQEGAARAQAARTAMQTRLMMLARQRQWPLSIRYRKRLSILSGIDPRGFPIYISTTDNIVSAATIGTNQLWPGGTTGLGLSGSSSYMKDKLALWDGGAVLATHVELVGRIKQVDHPSETNDHSTHVTGTMIASGVNPLAKGMAFGTPEILCYDFDNDVTEMFAASPNLLLSNHSYGEDAGWNYNSTLNRWEFLGLPGDTVDYKFGYYSDYAQSWDSIAYNAPNYLIVKSAGNNRDENGPDVGGLYFRPNAQGTIVSAGPRPAGISNNDGYDIIPTFGVAKNILTMGAVNPIPGGYSKPSDVVISDFSSWGPTDDGRIKPELVSDGVNVLSSIATSNTAYESLSGTSMSSPAATGSSMLLQEYYAKLNSGKFMRAATLKGLLIHTADEAGAANGPDFIFGYGLIDMPKAAAVITSQNTDQLIEENDLVNGNTYTQTVVASGKGTLAATLSWTDPPGAVDEVNLLNNRARKLVSDLDLRISDGTTTYFPWILDWQHPGNAATTGNDSLNNQEKVEISGATPGHTYTITVSAHGTLPRGHQAYSLIVSGVGGQAYCASAPASTAGTRIDNVTLNDLNNDNPAGCTGYSDFTSKTVSLQTGRPYPFSVKLSSCDGTTASKVVKIFIDYNENGSFADSGEQVAVSPVIPGNGTFTGTLTVPAGVKTGSTTIMRVVAVETTDTSAVQACGTYGKGETQDYRVTFAPVSDDVGISAVVDPVSTFCPGEMQRITLRVKNFGTAPKVNVPVSVIFSFPGGADTVSEVDAVCADTIPALSDVVFTVQQGFRLYNGGISVTIVARTKLSGDQDSTNDADTVTLTSSTPDANPGGVAEICQPGSVALHASTADSSAVALWYAAADDTVPIAAGNQTTTTVIPADNTYYMGLNDLRMHGGLASKSAYPNGEYINNPGNFISFTNDVPLTIKSARMYVGNAGTVTLILGDLVSFDSTTGVGTYLPISDNPITVYPTVPNPAPGTVTGNNAADTGAIFLLNIPVQETGTHMLIIRCDANATLFQNEGITGKPYPFRIPGVFSLDGNTLRHVAITDTAAYQTRYFCLYDIQLELAECATARVPVIAKTAQAPVITLDGTVFTSSAQTGNQWYVNDTLLAGNTSQSLLAIEPGVYKTVVTDSAGCSETSNEITFKTDAGVTVKPNPSADGLFTLLFYLKSSENVDLSVVNMLGQRIYQSSLSSFSGLKESSLDLSGQPAGVYVLRVQMGNTRYVRQLVIK